MGVYVLSVSTHLSHGVFRCTLLEGTPTLPELSVGTFMSPGLSSRLSVLLPRSRTRFRVFGGGPFDAPKPIPLPHLFLFPPLLPVRVQFFPEDTTSFLRRKGGVEISHTSGTSPLLFCPLTILV